jgi:hypothetical protein
MQKVIMIAYVATVAAIALMCRNPYDTCNAASTQRCVGNVVEMCDGGHWTPILDCDEGTFLGETADLECRQVNDIEAECVR